ncbi:jg640, partial [Pararge aegeria aegeria]
ATTTLETLLRAHVRRSSGDVIHERWVQPIVAHVASHELNSAQLNILENLLSLAAKLDQDIMSHILPHVKEECSRGAARLYGDVKCVLMLLGVARR